MSTTGTRKRPRRRRRARSHGGGRIIPLSRRSSSHFRPAIRDRGEEHLDMGRVQLEIDGSRARGRIEYDSEIALVGLDWSMVPEKRALHTFCDCAASQAGEKCEHVWAALLAVEALEPDAQPSGADRLSVRKDGPAQWGDLGVADTGWQAPRVTPRSAARTGGASWRSQLISLREEVEKQASAGRPTGPRRATAHRKVPLPGHFMINVKHSRGSGGLVLDVFTRRRGQGGKPDQFRRSGMQPEELSEVLLPATPPGEEPLSLEVVTAIPREARKRRAKKRSSRKKTADRIQRFGMPRRLYEPVLAHLGGRGLLGWWDGYKPSAGRIVSWDKGKPWQLVLRLEAVRGEAMRLVGSLERNGDSVPLSAPLLVLSTGDAGFPLILFPDSVARLRGRAEDLHWIEQLRDMREIVIPAKDLQDALSALYEIPDLPRLEIPEELGMAQETSGLRPRLVLTRDADAVLPNAPLVAELWFRYGSLEVSAGDPRAALLDDSGAALLRRDLEQEHRCLVRLLEAGARPLAGGQGDGLELNPQDVPTVAEPLLLEGWDVELQGTTLRPPSPAALRIESGIDWFELSGDIDFAGDEVDLRDVLEAVSRGDRFVKLADGSKGLLPASLSETLDSLNELAQGAGEDGGLKFFSAQALLVDALLMDMPPAAVDGAFAELRDKLRTFEQITPKKEPRGFRGELRAYQREGLGWLDFLREYGLGGILADDMGLGKTVQVLALLRANRTPKKNTGLPSLVVVPRSLLYNWIDEASRFTPTLKVVEYGGPGREKLQPKFGKYDIVLTTYGTLRRDIGFLSTVEFDTVILDEAQAIKNRDSQAAKASRLLVGRHRLALTGTPIENHLGELGSIFEFLNPGLVGRLPLLEILASGRNAGKKELARVAEGLRPFILRRTKAEVLPDLPPKTEQVLHTTLNERQRELYDQLRAGYQVSLLQSAGGNGKAGSAIEVLEALLRLRQIACHPGLVRDEWADAGSAKLDALFELMTEVLEEGHKILVFSQFTKLLAFVRERIEAQEIEYAYLDGSTRNRGEVVERFQTDPDVNVFLVSLKAGGVGLNLTAAGYVFLLDPWWNPAVEAQAIDRAHRIGQENPVFAYRMIAQDTVEEKIIELQASKRQIADAILEGEGGALGELTAEDLQMLLS